MPCPWTEFAVERCWKWAKQNELSCLQVAPSPVEAVETQTVSAQSVCVIVYSNRIMFCDQSTRYSHTVNDRRDVAPLIKAFDKNKMKT
jgi:hypothetical protein